MCYRDERDVDKKGDKSDIDEFRVILRVYLVNGSWGADSSDSRLFDADQRTWRVSVLCSILVWKPLNLNNVNSLRLLPRFVQHIRLHKSRT